MNLLFKITPKSSGKNHTPLKPVEDSSPTYDEMEDNSFRVSMLEDMIKGNVKIDDYSVPIQIIAQQDNSINPTSFIGWMDTFENFNKGANK